MREIIIKKMINGGKGLANDHDGLTVLIHGGLPEEKVSLQNIQKKNGYKTAEVKAVLEPSKNRIEPACFWYSECGGCDLMHANYQYQLSLKKEIVEDLYLRQFGADALALCPVDKVLPSPSQFHYRQRIRLMVSDNGEIGYRQAQSHKVTAINTCLIAHTHINDVLSAVKESQTAHHFIELSSEIELQWNPANDHITVIFHFLRKPRPTDIKKAEELLVELDLVENIILGGDSFQSTIISKKENTANPVLSFTLAGSDDDRPIHIEWEAGAFCQVNVEQNVTMIRLVLDFANIKDDENVLDLYCGMGNFSLPLSLHSKIVEGMEGQGASTRCAKNNSENNHISNTKFTKTDIHRGCAHLIAEGRTFDCVIVDPPRAGIPDLYDQLEKLTNKRLVYVSCDPATLFRDLQQLVQRGFSLKRIQPVDMFPQTHHIETVVLLEKN